MSVAAPQVTDHGQIRRMLLPPGWAEGEARENALGNSSLREFHPPDDEHPKLFFYYRGHDLGENAAEIFRSTLEAPEHELNIAEIWGLEIVMREKADLDLYSITKARTTAHNGRKVLVVEGKSKRMDEHSLAIFIDADLSGRFVQEISFQAPGELYRRYVDAVKNALATIEWV